MRASFTDPIIESKEYLGHMHMAENNRLYPGGGHIPFGDIIEGAPLDRVCGAI